MELAKLLDGARRHCPQQHRLLGLSSVSNHWSRAMNSEERLQETWKGYQLKPGQVVRTRDWAVVTKKTV